MSNPSVNTGTVALINPATGKFDDSLIPTDLQADADAAAASAASAAASALAAQAYVSQAGGGPGAAAAAASAAAAQAAAQTAAAAASASAAAAAASAASGGGATPGMISAAIAALPTVAQTGSYTDLANKPAIPSTAAAVGAVPTSSGNTAGGYPVLDSAAHLTVNQLPGGSEYPVKCPSDVQPLRASITGRTDITIVWLKATVPSYAAGYAVTGDRWRRWTG